MITAALEAVCRALSNDEAAVRTELEHVRSDWMAAFLSETAMQELVDELWDLREATAGRRLFDEATWGAKAGFVAAFRARIPNMAGCRYVPSFDVLNASVDRLRSRITWEEVYETVDAAVAHLLENIDRTSSIERNFHAQMRHCRGRLVEARRLNCLLRRTCQELQHLVVEPVPPAL